MQREPRKPPQRGMIEEQKIVPDCSGTIFMLFCVNYRISMFRSFSRNAAMSALAWLRLTS